MNDSFIYEFENKKSIHKYVTNKIFAEYGDGTHKKLIYDAIHICTLFTYEKRTYLINIDSYQEGSESCLKLMYCLKNKNNIIYSTLIKALKFFHNDDKYYPSKWKLQRIF